MEATKQVADAVAEIAAGEAIHQLEATLKELNVEIIAATQTLLLLCTKKGTLEERIRAIRILIAEHGTHHERPETTAALQHLHRVNRDEDRHDLTHHNGC